MKWRSKEVLGVFQAGCGMKIEESRMCVVKCGKRNIDSRTRNVERGTINGENKMWNENKCKVTLRADRKY